MNKFLQRIARETDRNLSKKLSAFSSYRILRATFLRLMTSKDFNASENALKNLETATQILDSLGILFWIDSGTCLGAIRELIKDDYDIDLGVF